MASNVTNVAVVGAAIAPSYGALWANKAGRRAGLIYLDSSGLVHVEVNAFTAAGAPGSDIIFTLPVGYRPSAQVDFIAYNDAIGAVQGNLAAAGTFSVPNATGVGVTIFAQFVFRPS